MRNILSWVLFLAVVAAGAIGWVRYLSQRDTINSLRQDLAAYQGIEAASEPFAPARFIRVEGNTLFFGLPKSVERDGQQFVEYEEREGTLISPDEIYRATETPSLSAINPGHELRLNMRYDPEDSQRFLIYAVYILD